MHSPKRNQCRSIGSATCALLTLALLLSGCVRVERNFGSSKTSYKQYPPGVWNEHWLVFRQRADGKNAIFESDKVTLIFPDLRRRERNSFDGEDIAIQIAGEGSSETTRTCNRNGRITTFNARYKDGVSTITFCGREVKLADSGRKIILTNQTIDLATEGSTVTVAAVSN